MKLTDFWNQKGVIKLQGYGSNFLSPTNKHTVSVKVFFFLYSSSALMEECSVNNNSQKHWEVL